MLEPIKPILQEQAGDADGGAGGNVERKRYVETRVEERYKPRNVREFLSRFGDKAEVALEHALKDSDEVIHRLMKRQAELEYDLQAAQTEVKSVGERIKQVEGERDQAQATLQQHTAKEREAQVEGKLKERFGDDVLVRRHKAYLAMDGYNLELDGDKLMLRQGDKRHNFDTIVNDAWYARYDDAKPSSDTPLPSAGIPTQPAAPSDFAREAADAWREAAEQAAQRTQIPGVAHG